MRRALVVLLAALLAAAYAQSVQLEARVFEIARELRCPSCVSESVADSSAPIAQQMRVLIQEQLEAGKSDDEIYAYFQARYGDWVLLDPPKRGIHLVAWLLPVVAAILAVLIVALLVRRWLANARAPITASAEDIERVRRELAGATLEAPSDGEQ